MAAGLVGPWAEQRAHPLAQRLEDLRLGVLAGQVVEKLLELLEVVHQVARAGVDEVGGVVDLVRDPGGEGTERGHLLLRDQLLLRPHDLQQHGLSEEAVLSPTPNGKE